MKSDKGTWHCSSENSCNCCARHRVFTVLTMLRLHMRAYLIWIVTAALVGISTNSNFCASAAPKSGSNVITLVDGNFSEVLQSKDLWLIDFYAPWCEHCKILDVSADLILLSRKIIRPVCIERLKRFMVVALFKTNGQTMITENYLDAFTVLHSYLIFALCCLQNIIRKDSEAVD